ncbi:MAG: hypothetical protein OXU81_09535 [Gammaproteobacteria bacterium]|nr:hypothetical protein [Gammaproteobacteria bacterium]
MTGDQDDYVLWNYMLDEHFLAADTHDGVVQLTITPHTLAKAVRETTGDVLEPEEAEQSLAKAVSSVYASRVRSSSWKLFALASADRTDVPFATGFLALSVLAAFHMHTDEERSARAFYPRLAEMLGCRLSGTYPEGFTGDGFAKLWHELDNWLFSRRGRRLAQPQADAARRYVAYPFAHVPLRQVDIERTPQFFDAFGYEPGSRVPIERLAYDLVDGTGPWRGFTETGQRVLRDPHRRALAIRQVAQELERWDGCRIDSSGRRTATIEVWMNIRRRRAQLHLLARRPTGFPEQIGNGEIGFEASGDSWYEPVALGTADGRLLSDGVRIDASRGRFSLQLRGSDVVPLAPCAEYSGYVSDRVLRAETQCAVLCRESMADEVGRYLRAVNGAEAHPRCDATLPKGWCLFTDVRARTGAAAPQGMERLSVEATTALVPEGGLRVGGRWTWLEGAPARVRVIGARDGLAVKIDEREVELDGDGYLPIASLAAKGEHLIEIGNRLRRKATVLAATVHPACEPWPDADGRGTPLALPQGGWTIVGTKPGQLQSTRGEADEEAARPWFEARWAIRIGPGRGATALHLHDRHEDGCAGRGNRIGGHGGHGADRSRAGAARWEETVYQAGIRKPTLRCAMGCSAAELAAEWRTLMKRARARKRANKRRRS